MPPRRLNLHELRLHWIAEQIFLLVLRVNVRQELVSLAIVVGDFVPNDVVLRVEHNVGFDPTVLATLRHDTGELATAEEVKLKVNFDLGKVEDFKRLNNLP